MATPRKLLLLAGALSVAALAVGAAVAIPALTPSVAAPPSAPRGVAMARMSKITPEMRRAQNEAWVRRQQRFADLSEARRAFGRELRVPSEAKLGTATPSVYIDAASGIATVIIGELGNPIAVTAEPASQSRDWRAYVAETAELKAQGVFRGDTTPHLLSVAGHVGVGQEPGHNLVGDEKLPRSGTVVWWDSGVEYTVIGRGSDSLQELLSIAESMYEE